MQHLLHRENITLKQKYLLYILKFKKLLMFELQIQYLILKDCFN